MAVVEIHAVSQTFGEGELAVQALKPASLAIAAGELVALLGPSGSGKSTLLLAISLIQPPTRGRIVIAGQTLYDDGPTAIDVRAFRRRHIGFVFQQHNLIPFLTAQENVALMLQINGVSRREARRRALDLLGYLEIAHRADALPARLSGGEQQRVAIGRALANEPALILADEPTAALDTERGSKVMAMLRKIARERRSAVIAVTHDHRMIEGFDTVYHLDDGRLGQAERRAAANPAAASP
ncbi:Lipoprotein-releasing system ATP-binding protein LolD [Rubrivivax sp. A210]|uniref:ABC transporter ATP-binding protein n=1 Tax=Rubrivivax sp. A210 TaxID=2772301 RepID=UPI0019B81D01|nr:ABC transporter ATP-binding protein [Rubrivivax sp. A210]CAD5373904.1 Lipoprotein-releasing system ATP-binding protein LolD [Rubrivivax sp. A210]